MEYSVIRKFSSQIPGGPGEDPVERGEESGGDYFSFGDQSPGGFGMKKNILSSDVQVKGSIRFEDELIFDGKLEGEVTSEGTLILGENSEVQGEIRTRSVSLSGRVKGNITVDEKCELKGRAELIGDLKAARLVIEEGATFVGRSEVTPNAAGAPKKPEGARGATPGN